ncbi:hypothetical protein [Galactobacillus timonensis]|uniref:hypothetical protein n=1 Tax=Galactobacillus timonensis TaxID=2041840 RepID=UPI000C845A84|nr:hypothetical protein [Galactobacillus timonensis]
MTETRQNLDELLQALESVRASKYPYVPKELVEKVALAEYTNQDDRAKARTETMKIIADYINNRQTGGDGSAAF